MGVEPGRAVGYRQATDTPPARPASLDELPFERQPAVRWYSPTLLASAGLQVVMASAFGSYLDKRELQSVLGQEPFTDLSDRGEVWVDYVADTGDGFDATYTVASLVGRSRLDVKGLADSLPRGDLLVFGGDQVYPDATAGGYEHRLTGPFTAALPWTPPDRRPALFAVPGNHDWYDGLTSFLRVFGQQKAIGGWQTYQTRSYFAVKLPHGWWLWGVDAYLDTYIDEPQLRFFDGLEVAPGDRIVVCTADPSWVEAAADPAAYRNLAYLERKIVAPKGAEVALMLAGDLHHYARYTAADRGRHKITAGGGGAFLHPTHGLPSHVPVRTDPNRAATETTYERLTTYPTAGRSRLLALGTLALPWRNPSFAPLVGLLHLLVTAEVLRRFTDRAGAAVADDAAGRATADAGARLVEMIGAATPGDVVADIVASLPSLALVVAVLLALVGFATPPRRLRPAPAAWAKRAMGLGHTALHLAAVVLVVWLTLQAASLAPPGWLLIAAAYVAALVLGGVVGSVVFAAYLTLANVIWGAEDNHAFSAQRHSGHKNFLRLHLGADGALTVHALGVDRPGRRWQAVPEAARVDDPWIVPTGHNPVPRLIDRVTFPGRPAAPAEPPVTRRGRDTGPGAAVARLLAGLRGSEGQDTHAEHPGG